MDDTNVGSDVPGDVPSDKPVESNEAVDDWDKTPEDGVDDEFPDNTEFWNKIRSEQPNKELPNSFFDRYKLAFLACFDGWPRVQWLFKRLQFLNIVFALAGFYLLVCFLFPVLIQLGYAGACTDMGLDYVLDYHKCLNPIELEFGSKVYPEVSKYDVLFKTISLDYGKLLDENINEGNTLRDLERERLDGESGPFGSRSNPRSFDDIFKDINSDDVVVKVEDVELVEEEDLSDE